MTMQSRFVLLIATVIRIVASQPTAVVGDTVSASTSLATNDPTVNGPVFVRVSIRNGTGAPVILNMAASPYGYTGFGAKLTIPDGRVLRPAKPADELSTGVRVSIPPFDAYDAILLVNKWFDFGIAGHYVLDLEVTEPLVSLHGLSTFQPNLRGVGIDVGPRDPVRLERVCADLESRIRNASTTAQALEAAEILRHVKDPVATFYLSSLLGTDRGTQSQMILGLEAIGDAAAVEALIGHRNDASDDVRELVQAALLRIEKRANDPSVKQRIRNAIR